MEKVWKSLMSEYCGDLHQRYPLRNVERRAHVADFSGECAEGNSNGKGDRLGRNVDSSVDNLGFEPMRVLRSTGRRSRRDRSSRGGRQSIRLVV